MGLLLFGLIVGVAVLYLYANQKYGLAFEAPEFHHANQVHRVEIVTK
jgi:hypothetical protein